MEGIERRQREHTRANSLPTPLCRKYPECNEVCANSLPLRRSRVLQAIRISSEAERYTHADDKLEMANVVLKLCDVITAIIAAQVFTPRDLIEHAVVLIEDRKIQRIAPRHSVEIPPQALVHDFSGNILAPGLIDIHIHGGAGHDVMEGSQDALSAVEGLLAKNGVTSYFPTTVTASLEKTLSSLEKLAQAIGRNHGDEPRARPLGVHLEGPFISPVKRGVHPRQHLIEPSTKIFDRFWSAAAGRISLLTIAPELPGATDLIRHATRNGVRCSLGHSDATEIESRAGIEAGAVHATHTFNAMRAFDHRKPGILGTVLSSDRLTADIIADGVHVDPEVVKMFLRVKGEERAVLISDAISATGMPNGRYLLGDFEVEVRGRRCEREGQLAGSVLTLDQAVRNIMKFAGWKLQSAIRLATYNPAKLLGIENRKGQLAAGCDADAVVLSAEGKVLRTIIAGRLI